MGCSATTKVKCLLHGETEQLRRAINQVLVCCSKPTAPHPKNDSKRNAFNNNLTPFYVFIDVYNLKNIRSMCVTHPVTENVTSLQSLPTHLITIDDNNISLASHARNTHNTHHKPNPILKHRRATRPAPQTTPNPTSQADLRTQSYAPVHYMQSKTTPQQTISHKNTTPKQLKRRPNPTPTHAFTMPPPNPPSPNINNHEKNQTPTSQPPDTIEYATPKQTPNRTPKPRTHATVTPERPQKETPHQRSPSPPASPQTNTDTPSPPIHDFKILLQLTHPEQADPSQKPPNEATITEILTATLHHHQFREPHLLFVLHSVTHHETKRRTKPQTGWASYYHVTLRPNPNASDAFDAELFYEQATCLVLQQWHKHRNDQFFQPFPSTPDTTYACALFNPEVIQPVSTNPWTQHIHLLLPATNSFTEKARGILLGPTPTLFNTSRRSLDHLTTQLYHSFKPALTNTDNIPLGLYYPTAHSFRQDVGIRTALYPSPNYTNNNKHKKTSSYKIYYISTATEKVWKLLARINKQHETLKATDIDGVPFEVVAFPTSASTILPVIADIVSTTRELKLITTKRFQTPMDPNHRKQILRIPMVKALVPIFPTHCADPIAFRLALQPTPQTVSLNSDTLHLLPGIPHDALIPLSSTETPYADAAREPPKPSEPCPGLTSFQSRWTSFTGPTDTASSPSPTTPSRNATKKLRTTNPTTPPPHSQHSINSTALLSKSPSFDLDDDSMSHTSSHTVPTQDNSQLTDFGGIDELIYQFIDDHASTNPHLRNRMESLLKQTPRPFSSFAEFKSIVCNWGQSTH